MLLTPSSDSRARCFQRNGYIQSTKRSVQPHEREVVFHAGDTGDNFYIVADGTVQVLDHDRIVRTLATGVGFGEIALMGNATRTMTVRAVGAVQLYGIRSADSLSAVTSIGTARSAAEATSRMPRAGRQTPPIVPSARR